MAAKSGKPDVVEYFNGKELWSWENTSQGLFKAPQAASAAATSVLGRLAAAFVPEGTVSDDYYAFQLWDSIQGLCSYIRGMLSSHAILKGIGSTTATPGSAVFQFFLRDFSGMLGGVLFALLQGSGLDSHAKQWRLFADCFNNVGYVLELLSPVLPSAFLLLACLGSIARAVTGVAAGATRAALTQHFARAGNAADVSAKEGSQETAVTLIGMAVGMMAVHATGGHPIAVWTLFLALTGLHIYANIRAMRSLHLTSLNRPRFNLILQSYLAKQGIPSVEQIADTEPLLAPPIADLLAWLQGAQTPVINLGARFSDLDCIGKQKLLALPAGPYFCWKQSELQIFVVLSPGASKLQMLQSYAEAWMLANHRENKQGPLSAADRIQDAKAASEADNLSEKAWQTFVEELQKQGWDINRISMGESGWRVARRHQLHID